MSIAKSWTIISSEEYLAAEIDSPTKHEFLGGVVYAMSGGKANHNLVASNALISLGAQLKGQPCRAFNSDMKIRIRLPEHTRFYYPDASIVGRLNAQDSLYQDSPAMVIEVLSDSSRRLDMGEKMDAYLSIASLDLYLIVEPTTPTVIAFRRTESGFTRELWQGLDAVIPIPELELNLPLRELYEGVEIDRPAQQ